MNMLMKEGPVARGEAARAAARRMLCIVIVLCIVLYGAVICST